MTVPVLALNRLAHSFSRHRKGMVLCLAPVCTLSDPQCGQVMPLGQRRPMNQASAVASSGNSLHNLDQRDAFAVRFAGCLRHGDRLPENTTILQESAEKVNPYRGFQPMSDEEKLQLKKDKWWEIREKEAHIECLRQRLKKQMDSLRRVADLWDNGSLSTQDGRFMMRALASVSLALDPPPALSLEETVATLEELGRSEAELETLKDDFAKLLS